MQSNCCYHLKKKKKLELELLGGAIEFKRLLLVIILITVAINLSVF